MRVSLGHGSPFVYCLYRGGGPAVSFSRPPQIWSGSEKEPVLGITIGDHHYGLFGPTGSIWTGIGGTKLINSSRGKPYFSVAILPDDRPETLAEFRKYAYNHVVDTEVDYRVEVGHVLAAYDASELGVKLEEIVSFRPKPRRANPEPMIQKISEYLTHMCDARESAS